MAVTVTLRNYMLDQAATNKLLFASLHTADPGTTGASEATGGSPAYTRKAISWDAAASGSMGLTGSVTFDVPAGSFSHYGLWDAVSAGNFQGGNTLSATETFAAQGTYTLTDVTFTD